MKKKKTLDTRERKNRRKLPVHWVTVKIFGLKAAFVVVRDQRVFAALQDQLSENPFLSVEIAVVGILDDLVQYSNRNPEINKNVTSTQVQVKINELL